MTAVGFSTEHAEDIEEIWSIIFHKILQVRCPHGPIVSYFIVMIHVLINFVYYITHQQDGLPSYSVIKQCSPFHSFWSLMKTLLATTPEHSARSLLWIENYIKQLKMATLSQRPLSSGCSSQNKNKPNKTTHKKTWISLVSYFWHILIKDTNWHTTHAKCT